MKRISQKKLKPEIQLPNVRKSKDFAGMKFLIVEDHPDLLELTTRLLMIHGADSVNTASTAQEARDRLSHRSYDAILMDIALPDTDGLSLTKELRRNGYRHPIVAVTAHALNGYREQCLNAGCDEYLTKPLEIELLIRAIKKIRKL